MSTRTVVTTGSVRGWVRRSSKHVIESVYTSNVDDTLLTTGVSIIANYRRVIRGWVCSVGSFDSGRCMIVTVVLSRQGNRGHHGVLVVEIPKQILQKEEMRETKCSRAKRTSKVPLSLTGHFNKL